MVPAQQLFAAQVVAGTVGRRIQGREVGDKLVADAQQSLNIGDLPFRRHLFDIAAAQLLGDALGIGQADETDRVWHWKQQAEVGQVEAIALLQSQTGGQGFATTLQGELEQAQRPVGADLVDIPDKTGFLGIDLFDDITGLDLCALGG